MSNIPQAEKFTIIFREPGLGMLVNKRIIRRPDETLEQALEREGVMPIFTFKGWPRMADEPGDET